jgi:putative oxidoreductase
MQPAADLIGRILIAILFIIAGIGKIENPAGTMQYIASGGLPLPMAAYLVAVLIEVGGSILLVLGWQTRAVAAIMALFTLVTAFAFHKNFADHGQQINFLKNLAIAGGLFHILAYGAGAFSLDHRLSQRGAHHATA